MPERPHSVETKTSAHPRGFFRTELEDCIRMLHTSVPVGEHMFIHAQTFHSPTPRMLSDGSILNPETEIGRITMPMNEVMPLSPDESLRAFTRDLFESVEGSLRELAGLCEENDRAVEGMKFFYGTSHLAGPLARRLGFDVFPIEHPVNRMAIKWFGRNIAGRIAKKNAQWKKTLQNYKEPKEAIISRGALIERYGSRQTPETR